MPYRDRTGPEGKGPFTGRFGGSLSAAARKRLAKGSKSEIAKTRAALKRKFLSIGK